MNSRSGYDIFPLAASAATARSCAFAENHSLTVVALIGARISRPQLCKPRLVYSGRRRFAM
jgi:hypothetical protein